MASVSQDRRRRQGSLESRSFESQRRAAYEQPKKKRRWLKRLVIGFTLLAIFVLALPTIISYTGLRNTVLRLALGNIHGAVQAGGASLSWFGALQFNDLELRDERGEAIFTIAKVESERSLWGIITNLDDLGTFRIVRPQASVVLRPDGSNFEDVLAPLLKSKEHKPHDTTHTNGKLPAVTVEVVDGNFKLNDTATQQKWELDKFNFKLRMSPERSLPAELTMSGEVPFEGRTAKLTLTGAPGQGGGQEQINVKIDALPLAMFRGLADRFAPGLQLVGYLSTDLQLAGIANTSTDPLKISGTTAIDNFEMTGGPISTDHVVLRRIELPCKLAYQNKKLDVEQLGLSCDVGQLGISGSLAIPEKFDAESLRQFERTAVTAQGQLDLAKLAALLPSTLHVRQGTQITSGQIQIGLANRVEANGVVWNAQILASDLAAMDNGRRVAWEQPVNLQVALRSAAGNYSIDQLACSASFLSLSGQGSLDAFQVDASCDLDKLMSELNQFVDLGTLRLAGRGSARVVWQRAVTGIFQTSADVRLQGLQVALPGMQPWQDDAVVASVAATGNLEDLSLSTLTSANLKRLDSAQLTASVDNTAANTHEEIGVRLLQGVDCSTPNSRWPIEARVKGQVGRWWPRIASWLDIQGLELGGGCDLAMQATYSKAGVEIHQAQGTMANLHVWGWDTVFIDEPEVRLEASGGYEFNSGRLMLNRTSLLTSSISLQTESASVSMPSTGPFSAQGAISYSANLDRLSRWMMDPRLPPEFAMTGLLTGSAEMAHAGTATNGRVSMVVDNFAMYSFDEATRKQKAAGRVNPTRTPAPFWQETKLTLGATGGFDSAADAVQLTALEINSQALALQAAGRIDALKTKQNLDLAGTVSYEWKTLNPLLEPYLGKHVEIAGRHKRKFAVRGPLGGDLAKPSVGLVSAKTNRKKPGGSKSDEPLLGDTLAFLKPLTADFSLGWSHARILGLRFDKLDVDARMQNGVVNFQPINTAVGEEGAAGRLTVTPVARLTPNPSEIELGKGPLLTNIQITEELSNAWMKYIAPVMADATRAQGVVSVDLNEARVPLDDPAKANLNGRLTVKNVLVTPGPLAQPLVLIAQQVEAVVKKRPPQLVGDRDTTLLKIDNQKVDFHMADGRVYHQDLQMQVGEVTITTRGWVGLDETLGLVAEIPIKPEWAQKNPALAGMREQVIKIPITGTLSKPKLDKRAIDQIAGSLIQGAVRGTIENELGKQLDRLFQPRD
jgi:translocation and assembly module TamB